MANAYVVKHLKPKIRIHEILSDMQQHVSTSTQANQLMKLTNELADLAYIDGMEMAQRLMRLKLGIDVEGDAK